jgi:hypothetical protein
VKNMRALVLASSLILLTACGAGQNAQTAQPYTPVDGVQGATSSIQVRNVVVVTNAAGDGILSATLVDQTDATALASGSPDRLTGVLVGGKAATLTPAAPTLPVNSPITFSGPASNATAVVKALGAKAGTNISVTFTFEVAGDLTVTALVRENNEEFAAVATP